jgi:hypothetical protein
MTDRGSESPPRLPVRPLTEGQVVKGGHNPGTSQIRLGRPLRLLFQRRLLVRHLHPEGVVMAREGGRP